MAGLIHKLIHKQSPIFTPQYCGEWGLITIALGFIPGLFVNTKVGSFANIPTQLTILYYYYIL